MRTPYGKLLLVATAAMLFAAAGADAGLLGLYQFEDVSGTVGSTIADTSNNGNHGTVAGAAITLAPGPAGHGNAGGFGAGRVQANLTGAGTSAGDFAVAFWMQSNSASQSNTYITARENGTPQLSVIYEYANDQVELFRAGSGPDPRPGSQINVADTGWRHIVYTRTGTDYDRYVDGVKTDIGTLSGAIATTESLAIGSTFHGLGDFNGQLDDVAWFNNGLTQAQVTTVMGGDFSEFAAAPPPPPGPQIAVDSYTYPAAAPGWSGFYTDPGLTKLTDGLSQVHRVWPSNPVNVAPLAGWRSTDMAATFNFAAPQAIDTVVAYLADSDGNAGVGLPTSINLSTTGGFSQDFVVTNPAGSGMTIPVEMSGLGITTDNITLTATRAYEWTMATEVEFFAAVGPGPLEKTAYTWQVLKDNPRFYWSFNEPTSTDNAKDLVRGQANDELAAYGEAHRELGATENLSRTARFDGSDSFSAVDLGDHEMPGAWAIEFWMKADGSLAGSRGDYLVHAGGPPNGPGANNPAAIFDFGVGGDNKLELYSGAGRTAGNGPTIDDNDWHHVVMTFYGNDVGLGVADRVDIAVDGTVAANIGRNGFWARFELDEALRIGAAYANGTNGFEGRIDEVALYDLSGLTEAQVAARTAQIAAHHALAAQPAATDLSYVQGVTYQIDGGTPTGSGVYADPSQTKLTDGVIGSSGNTPWGSDEWAGWSNVDPILTFDLGAKTQLDSLFLDYLVSHRVGIRPPDSVMIEFSLDGVDYTSIGSITSTSFNDFDPTPLEFMGYNRRLVVDLDDTMARYVRMTFANDMQWTFLGEAQFVQSEATGDIPEPGCMAMLATALAGLVGYVRRRRRT